MSVGRRRTPARGRSGSRARPPSRERPGPRSRPRSELVPVSPRCRAVRNQRAGHVYERHVVCRLRLPADSQRPEVVVPAVRALDHPATRPASLALAWLLAAPSKVRPHAARTNSSLRVVIVVALVETEVLRSTGPARRGDDHGIERLADHPLGVDVRASQRDAEHDTAPVSDDVAFRSQLPTIGRIGPGELPPFGAFTEALSSEAQAHSMPRSSS